MYPAVGSAVLCGSPPGVTTERTGWRGGTNQVSAPAPRAQLVDSSAVVCRQSRWPDAPYPALAYASAATPLCLHYKLQYSIRARWTTWANLPVPINQPNQRLKIKIRTISTTTVLQVLLLQRNLTDYNLVYIIIGGLIFLSSLFYL